MAPVAIAVLMVINLAMWALVVVDLKPTPGADFWFHMLMTGLPVLAGLFSVLFPFWIFRRGFHAASVAISIVLLMIGLPVFFLADVYRGLPG